MSMKPKTSYPIPEQTQRVAKAAFARGHIYLKVTEALGMLYHDEQFAELFPRRGQPAASPAQLALATVLHMPKGYQTVRRPMRYVDALIGNRCWGWN